MEDKLIDFHLPYMPLDVWSKSVLYPLCIGTFYAL